MSNKFLLITNAVALILIIMIFFLVIFLEKNVTKKATSNKQITTYEHTINVRNITISGVLIAMAVLLNGFTSNLTIMGFIQIRLGDVIVFYMGYRCGYLLGFTNAIISDLLKSLLFVAPGFHFGFTFNACLLSVIGAWNKNHLKNQPYFLIITFILNYLLTSFALDIIWLTSLGYIPLNKVSIMTAYVSRLIELTWALPIYLSFVLIIYRVDKLL